jgi:hypothetical protein
MKILIVNNKNTDSLSLLLKSINEKFIGDKIEYCTFDSTGKMGKESDANVTGNQNLKQWVLDNLTGQPDDLYMIIDENKIIVEHIDVGAIQKTMSDPEIFCFSLSLGKNITFCSNMNCENVFLPISEKDGILVWDWSAHYLDFGYPLNLDGTIFRGKELLKLVKNVAFSNTLELESNLQIFDDYPKNRMAAFSQSKIIEIVFEKPELIGNFDYNKLTKDRIKYQILAYYADSHKVSDQIKT